jgi:hypothetical protein
MIDKGLRAVGSLVYLPLNAWDVVISIILVEAIGIISIFATKCMGCCDINNNTSSWDVVISII